AKVPMGTSLEDMIDQVEKYRPTETSRVHGLDNIRSELGEFEAEVEPFYMSRILVTNAQYLKYVKATGARFPFHWWKDGKPQSYIEKRSEATALFPDKESGVDPRLLFWEARWDTLPYAVPPGK